jgi:hypothetical protein
VFGYIALRKRVRHWQEEDQNGGMDQPGRASGSVAASAPGD